jgi:hypothetical protein
MIEASNKTVNRAAVRCEAIKVLNNMKGVFV